MMEVPEVILIREMGRKDDCCAAVPGAMMLPTAVRLTANTLLRRIAAA